VSSSLESNQIGGSVRPPGGGFHFDTVPAEFVTQPTATSTGLRIGGEKEESQLLEGDKSIEDDEEIQKTCYTDHDDT
jgi:hypothetical protein